MHTRARIVSSWRNQHHNLLRLLQLRLIALSGQSIATALAYYHWGDSIAFIPLSSGIALMVAISLISFLDWCHKRQISDHYLFIQLMLDLLSLSYLLYFSGGVTNPFISFFLVPLCIAVAVLPWRYSWIITAYSLIANTFLLFYFVPIEALMHHHGSGPNLHLVGMWINFICSALIISYFVVRMSQVLRQQEQALNQEVESRLRDEQLLSLAGQAANTAHELGTPLSTIALLVEELPYADAEQQQLDIQQLQQQVQSCKKILQQLSFTAQQTNSLELQAIQVSDFVQQSLNDWQLLRPQANYRIEAKSLITGHIVPKPALKHALLNLLNNAANSCDEEIVVSLKTDQHFFYLDIQDQGDGFSPEVLSKLGEPQESQIGSAIQQGLGLGLMLSIASIEQSHGEIFFSNNTCGALINIKLPLEPEKPD